MSVQHFRPSTDPEAWLPNSFRGRGCYYCHETLTDPFILWMGAGEPIALHPPCTVELAIRLFCDVHAIEKRYDYVTKPRRLAEKGGAR